MGIAALRTVLLSPIAVAEGATTPDPGGQGWAWSTTLSKPVYWNGTHWHATVAIHVGTTAPANPFTGQLWVDTT